MTEQTIDINSKDRSPAFLITYGEVINGYQEFDFESFMKDGKILIYGLPRHGNHWVTNLVADALGVSFADKVTFTHNSLKAENIMDKSIKRALCLMRDIRDVIVSLYHFLPKEPSWQSSHLTQYDDIEQFYFDIFVNVYITLPHWKDWLTYCEDLANAGVPILHYERLFDNPTGELNRIFRSWKIDVLPDSIEESVKKNTISIYQRGQKESLAGKALGHFSQGGGHGKFHQELPPIVLEDVNRRYGEYLRRWGYKV